MAIQTTWATPSAFHQAEADRAAAMQEFECIFAMFSEVAAESCRLAAQGVDVHCEIARNGLYLVICSPVPVGPLCVRGHYSDSFNTRSDIGRGQVFPSEASIRSGMCVTHRFSIGFTSPMSEVEPLIETILRRFALMDRNMDACRVWGVAA